MVSPVITVQHLLCSPYEGFKVEVSELALTSGFYHLLGANGAGKSTFLDMLAGLYPQVSQSISLNGTQYSSLSLQQLAQQRAYLTQQNTVHFAITGYEMLSICFDTNLSKLKEMISDHPIIEGLEVQHLLHKPLSELSGGERQRCYLASVLLRCDKDTSRHANLLLLDEPFTGLDIKHTLWLIDHLTHISEHICVIASHHEVNFALKSENPCLMMKNGALIGDFKAGRDIKTAHLLDSFGLKTSQISYENNAYYQISWN